MATKRGSAGSLDSFFYPRGVVVVGASKNPGKAGHQVMKNLTRENIAGPVYAVNPNEKEILGVPCFSRIQDVPFGVELMIVTIPAEAVPKLMRDAAQRGDIKAAVILASGFAETGIPERVEFQRETSAAAAQGGIRIMGPNCVGVMNAANQLDTTFAPRVKMMPGGLSIISQSGALGASLLMFAGDQAVPMGFSKFCHVGNQSDVSVLEVLNYYAEDESTKAVGMYLEGVSDGRAFMDVARKLSSRKPFLVLKVGRSEQASAAAFSHTGSLAGSDKVYDGCFQQIGAVRVATMDDLLCAAKAFSMQPLPPGDRVCVLTEAGGPGTVAADEISCSNAARLASFSSATVDELKKALPPMAMVGQPDGYVDMSAAALEDQHAAGLELVLKDDGVDAVIVISVPPTFLSPVQVAEGIVRVARNSGKPVLVCLMAGEWVKEARAVLENGGVPTFDMPEQAARAAAAMVRYARFARETRRGGAEE